MKIICDRQELLDSITGVGRAVSGKTSIPAIEGILFQCDDTKLKLTGYDLEIGIITYANATIREPGEIVINERLLGDILRKSNGDTVTIECDDNLRVTVSSGNAEYKLIGIPASDFPDLPIPEVDSTLSISGKDLQELIKRTSYAISTNNQKPVHTGSKFILSEGCLTVASVDGHRLAVARKENDWKAEETSFIIPGKTLNEVSKLIADNEDNVRIGTARKYAVFNLVGYTVITRLLEGDFINFNKSIPTSYKTEAVVECDALTNAVERVSTIINDRFKSPIRMNFEENSIKISCSTALGSVSDEIPCSLEGNEIELGFNFKYVLDAMKNAGVDHVRVCMNETTMPMVIRPVDSEEFTFLILPVRLR